MSGFFKKKQERGGDPRAPVDATIPRIETRRASVEVPQESPSSITFGAPPILRRISDVQESSRSFFRIPRRKKASSVGKEDGAVDSRVPSRATSTERGRLSMQSTRSHFEALLPPSLATRSSTLGATPSPTLLGTAIMAAGTSLAAQGSPILELKNPMERNTLSRQSSRKSIRSFHSALSNPASDKSGSRGDAIKAMKSRGRSSTYAGTDTQRKATSATRSSKFFSMGRLRRDNDDTSLFRPISREFSPPASPPKTQSPKPKPNLTAPSRLEGEAPCNYLGRLGEMMHNTVAASVLAMSGSDFHQECLRLYMQHFDFHGDPLDMALRKLLMDTHLPKETQQIDRVLNAFSERYQDCNPRLYDSHVTPYVLSFALIMLHTDRFNQNNKYKMTKAQFLKNTTSEHTGEVSQDVLEYFYDNIISTPFILVEDDADALSLSKTSPNDTLSNRGASLSTPSLNQTYQNGAFGRKSLDLYPLIMEDKLSSLRPQLGSILEHDYVLSYTGTVPIINIAKLHNAFVQPAILQLVSARSRPEAFVSDQSAQNPDDTDPGLVDIQITKIGVLKRKEQKKPGSKPVYREWGVMLTPSQLLLFKNVAWVKHYQSQVKEHNSKRGLLVLTPPVQNYSPDTYLPTSDTVAMYDSSASKKHNHFCFLGRGGEQTHLTASSEEEMNDWVAKINYAAAFQTVGVRIRDTETATDTTSTHKRLHRHTSSSTASILSGHMVSRKEIAQARRELLQSKIQEMSAQLIVKEQQLSIMQQHARNLCTLTPVQPRTRASVISAAGSLSAKMSWARMELTKVQCHRDILAKDLALELDPTTTVYTTPIRSKTPPPSSGSERTSPSKKKKGSAVQSIMRQVSNDTLRRVHRKPVGDSDLSRGSTSSSRQAEPSPTNQVPQEEFDPSMIKIDHTKEALDLMFHNPPEPSGAAKDTISKDSETVGHDPVADTAKTATVESLRPQSVPGLKLNLSLVRRKPLVSRGQKDSNEADNSSVLSSPSSGNSSGHFILHGRKVSVVQAPPSLMTSPPHEPYSLPSLDSTSDIFLDAPEAEDLDTPTHKHDMQV